MPSKSSGVQLEAAPGPSTVPAGTWKVCGWSRPDPAPLPVPVECAQAGGQYSVRQAK